jgi:small subunit ribosomal protein S6
MRHYEMLFIVKPTITNEETLGKLSFVKELLEKNGAQIVAVDDRGTRALAYPIEKHERGHYFVVYYKGVPASADEVLRNLRIDEEIIRFLNVKFDKKKEIASWDKLVASVKKKTEVKEETPAPAETPAAE